MLLSSLEFGLLPLELIVLFSLLPPRSFSRSSLSRFKYWFREGFARIFFID